MEAEQRHTVGELLVVGGDEAGVAEREQVLGRVEAEGGEHSGARHAFGAESLGSVLEDRDPELGKARERHHAAEQVHGHQRARLPGHFLGDVLRDRG